MASVTEIKTIPALRPYHVKHGQSILQCPVCFRQSFRVVHMNGLKVEYHCVGCQTRYTFEAGDADS